MKEVNNQTQNEKNNEHLSPKKKYSINLKKLLGRGSFGSIYSGKNKNTNEKVAIKLEPVDTDKPQLIYEYKKYKLLQGGYGFPKVYDYSSESKCNILIIELLGNSIEKLFNKAQKRFSFLTVLMIMDQIVTRIEYMHNKNLLHRDIKPDNFLIGKGNKRNVVYAIDFGLSKKYRDSQTGLHIPYNWI